MGKLEYDWEIGSPATLEPHSLAKHTILRKYVEEYVKILTSDRRIPDFRLTLVDGFAGGGEYVVEGKEVLHDGSPFILIDAVRAATEFVKIEQERRVEINANFVFVEQKPSNYLYLKHALDRRLDKVTRDKVTTLQGDFKNHLDRIIVDIKSAPGRRSRPIFVLDQYGYTDVPMNMIATIMRELPRAEIFLTFAFDWIGAYARGPQAQIARIKSALHIAPHLQGFADGTREIEEIDDLEPQDKIAAKRYVQQFLHESFAKQGNALFYTPFFITSRESNRSYWFLHLANSVKANQVVKQLHWSEKNHFTHYGGAGLMMLGYDPARPLDDKQQEGFAFDKSARDQTIDALLADIPRRLHEKFPGGVSFDDLYKAICNETPASPEILGEVIMQSREIESVTPRERIRRVGEIDGKDIVRLSKQLRLIPMARDKK